MTHTQGKKHIPGSPKVKLQNKKYKFPSYVFSFLWKGVLGIWFKNRKYLSSSNWWNNKLLEIKEFNLPASLFKLIHPSIQNLYKNSACLAGTITKGHFGNGWPPNPSPPFYVWLANLKPTGLNQFSFLNVVTHSFQNQEFPLTFNTTGKWISNFGFGKLPNFTSKIG